MTIKIKYHADIDKIEKIAVGDYIDLRTAEDVVMLPGDYKQISLGVSMKLPEGYEAMIIPRSSTFRKYGIIMANGVGLIDETYCGDNDIWSFPAYATRPVVIHKNKRICQFRIMKHQPELEFEEVVEMEDSDRGGLGSTDDEEEWV